MVIKFSLKASCVPLMLKYGSFSRFVRLQACVTAVSPSWRFVRWVLLIESCLIAGEPKNRASPEQRNQTDPSTQRDLLRLLAEVHFISAEVQTHSFWSDFPSEQQCQLCMIFTPKLVQKQYRYLSGCATSAILRLRLGLWVSICDWHEQRNL